MEGDAAARIRADRLTVEETVGGYAILRYDFLPSELRAGAAGPESRSDAEVVDLSFALKDLIDGDGEPLYQPARLAVLRAVGESGKPAGSVRLIALEHAGGGRFTAEVAVR